MTPVSRHPQSLSGLRRLLGLLRGAEVRLKAWPRELTQPIASSAGSTCSDAMALRAAVSRIGSRMKIRRSADRDAEAWKTRVPAAASYGVNLRPSSAEYVLRKLINCVQDKIRSGAAPCKILGHMHGTNFSRDGSARQHGSLEMPGSVPVP